MRARGADMHAPREGRVFNIFGRAPAPLPAARMSHSNISRDPPDIEVQHSMIVQNYTLKKILAMNIDMNFVR
jgi:hypothetical protein